MTLVPSGRFLAGTGLGGLDHQRSADAGAGTGAGKDGLVAKTAKRFATYQNGSPTTVIGQPTSGTHVLDEFWRDAGRGVPLHGGGHARHVEAGQACGRHGGPVIRNHPDGILDLDVTTGHIKRYTGGYV